MEGIIGLKKKLDKEIYDFRIRQYRLKKSKIILCWWCGRKLWGNNVTLKEVDGHMRRMHKFCAEHMEIVKEGEK